MALRSSIFPALNVLIPVRLAPADWETIVKVCNDRLVTSEIEMQRKLNGTDTVKIGGMGWACLRPCLKRLAPEVLARLDAELEAAK